MQKIGDITNTATPDGEFTDGSVAGGVSPTLLPAEWFNTIQRELCNIVVESGGTLDPDNDTQILEAITKIAQGIIPDFTVVSSSTDTTAGRIVNVGWQGLGGATQIAMGKVSQFLANTDSTKPEYPGNGAGFQACYAPNRRGQIYLTTDNGLHVRFTLSDTAVDTTTPWAKVYTTLYKPTAGDVGAVPYRGPLGTDDLNTVTGSKYGRFCQPLSANATAARHYPITEAGALDVHQTSANGAAACVQEYRSFSSRRIFLRSYDPGVSDWTDWCEFYTTAKKPTSADVGAIPLTGSTGVTGIVLSSAELQSSSANSFRIGYGGYGTFWRNDGVNLYLMLTNQNDRWGNYNDLRPFRVSLNNGEVMISKLNLSDFGYFDARYQAKGSYTPAGQAYTKAESDARYNLKNTATKAANAMTSKDASTGVMEVVMSNITVAANTNVSVTFSTAFPSVCVGVVITYDGATRGNDSDSSIAVVSYTHTGCVLRANNASGKFMLIAKGY